MYFINSNNGRIYNTANLGHWGQATAHSSKNGIVVLYSISVGIPRAYPKIFLCFFDYSGRLIWKREFNGVLSSVEKRLAISSDGWHIVFSLFAKDFSQKGMTFVLDGDGKILDRIDGSYDPVFVNDSKTAILLSQKELLVLDIIEKKILSKIPLKPALVYEFIPDSTPGNWAFVYKHTQGDMFDELLGIDGKRRIVKIKFNPIKNGLWETRGIAKKHLAVKISGGCKSIDLEDL
jgi:hypothetical protein